MRRQDGFGITHVLSYMVAHHLAEGRLVPLLTRFQMPPVPISVVHHEGRQSTPKIRAFIDLAIATLRADATLHQAGFTSLPFTLLCGRENRVSAPR